MNTYFIILLLVALVIVGIIYIGVVILGKSTNKLIEKHRRELELLEENQDLKNKVEWLSRLHREK